MERFYSVRDNGDFRQEIRESAGEVPLVLEKMVEVEEREGEPALAGASISLSSIVYVPCMPWRGHLNLALF